MCTDRVPSAEEGGRKERKRGMERSDNYNGGTMGNSAFPPPELITSVALTAIQMSKRLLTDPLPI